MSTVPPVASLTSVPAPAAIYTPPPFFALVAASPATNVTSAPLPRVLNPAATMIDPADLPASPVASVNDPEVPALDNIPLPVTSFTAPEIIPSPEDKDTSPVESTPVSVLIVTAPPLPPGSMVRPESIVMLPPSPTIAAPMPTLMSPALPFGIAVPTLRVREPAAPFPVAAPLSTRTDPEAAPEPDESRAAPPWALPAPAWRIA